MQNSQSFQPSYNQINTPQQYQKKLNQNNISLSNNKQQFFEVPDDQSNNPGYLKNISFKRSQLIKKQQQFNPIHLNKYNQNQKNLVVKIDYALKSRAGQYTQSIRKLNQDGAFMIKKFMGLDDCYYFGVCDGHGQNGGLVSSFVKKVLPKNVNLNIKHDSKQGINNKDIDMQQICNKAFNQTHKELVDSSTDVQLSGTTAVTVLIKGTNIWCANCGDSRAIQVKSSKQKNQQFKIVELSEDHKPSLNREKFRIIQAGGRVLKQVEGYGSEDGCDRVWKQNEDSPGLAMTRSIGDLDAREAGVISDCEVKQFSIDEDDMFIVIASDGVWEFLDNEQVSEIIYPFYKNKESPKKAAEVLVKQALQTWLDREDVVDDITCLVLFLDVKDGNKLDDSATDIQDDGFLDQFNHI